MTPDVKKFCSTLVRSRTMQRDTVEHVYRAWREAEPKERGNLSAFLQYVVKHSPVTSAQVEKLLKSDTTAESAPDPVLDVELILTRDPQSGLNRRDLFMLLAGAAGGAVAVLLPVVVAWRSSPPPAPPQDSP